MFHDAPVARIVLERDGLRIETEAFDFSPDETLPAARILIAEVRDVLLDDAKVAAFVIESDDAQVYGLDALPDGVLLTLVWQFLSPRAPDAFRTYRFPGATLHVEALSGGPLRPAPACPDHGA